jgi:hypothetical protein
MSVVSVTSGAPVRTACGNVCHSANSESDTLAKPPKYDRLPSTRNSAASGVLR